MYIEFQKVLNNTCILSILMMQQLFSNVSSSTGTINFDVNSDNQIEATLNTTGLGIGTSSVSSNLHVNGNAIISDQLLIGATGGNSTLEVHGALGLQPETMSASGNITDNEKSLVLADTSSDNIVISLTGTQNIDGRIYEIVKKSKDNDLIITGSRVNNADQLEIGSGNYGAARFLAYNNSWYLLSQNNLTSVSSANLVGYWSFNDTSDNTTIKDHSSYGTTLAMEEFSSSANNGYTDGVMGSALLPDGIDDTSYTSDPADGHLDILTNGSFSISLWFNAASGGSGTKYFIHKGGDYIGYYISFHFTAIRFVIDDNIKAYDPLTASGGPMNTISDDNWHHLVVSVSGNGTSGSYDANLYVDHDLKTASKSYSGYASLDHTSNFTLGYPNIPSFSGSFKLDEVKVYNKALSASEVKELYEMGI